jgi:anti-anti-sigma factor
MPLPHRDLPQYRFGKFEVCLQTGELSKNGRRVHLQRKPFELLTCLLEQGGRLVSRDSLRQRLWPADTFVDFDNGLNTALSKLRQALGDTAERPRYIETFEGRGYRFLPTLEELANGPGMKLRELDVERTRVEPDVALVELAGKMVYGPECRQIEWLTAELLDEGERKIVFDLSRLSHLDSSGLGTLVMCSAKIKEAGGRLRVSSAEGHVKTVLKITDAGKILDLHPSRIEALQAFAVGTI